MTELPWLLPVWAAFVVAGAVAARPLGRMLGSGPLVAWMLVASAGLVIASTLTPFSGVPVLYPECGLGGLHLASARELRQSGDIMLNVLLLVPLGVAIGAIPRTRVRIALAALAALAPLAIEMTQLNFAPLHRSCEAADVVNNAGGLLVAVAAGIVLRRAHDAAR